MKEEWRFVLGYEGIYEASSLGRIRSWRGQGGCHRQAPHILSPKTDHRGRLRVLLYKEGERREWQVHRVVLYAFAGPCPEGHEGCHNDGNHKNNRADNLRWDTRKGNAADSVRHGTIVGDRKGEKHPLARLTEEDVRCIRAEPRFRGVSAMLARCFSITQQYASAIRSRKKWKHLSA